MNGDYSNVAFYSIESDKVFERNLNYLKEEIASIIDIKEKRSNLDFNGIDKMLDSILITEALKNNLNFNDYKIATTLICKFNKN